jgi:hypothetical protein
MKLKIGALKNKNNSTKNIDTSLALLIFSAKKGK